MTDGPRQRRRFRLRHLLFFALLLSGIIPLALSNFLLIGENRETLEDQERLNLVNSAQALSREISGHLRGIRRQLTLVGESLLVVETPVAVADRLRQPWVQGYLQGVMAEHAADLAALRVLTPGGEGIRIATSSLAPAAEDALDAAFLAALEGSAPVYRFAVLPGGEPVAALAAPVAGDGGGPALLVEGLLRLAMIPSVFREEAGAATGAGLFLLGADGTILWSRGITPEMQAAVAETDVVADFVRRPLALTGQYSLADGGQRLDYLVQVSPVEENGWGVVLQRPLASAFEAVDEMVFRTLVFSLLLLALALFFAVFFARRLSQPIQRMAETSHQIAAGNFGRRVEVEALSAELAELAEDFNLMGEHVENYVVRLQQAARVNRELFIGSLRAFAAAIDAKDPYTRGHSERVAALSRSIARHLQLPEEVQDKVWIGALLHDVGKIGIEDRVLRKAGGLTPEEYEQMKAHPVIGAEILSPIEQLRDIIPAVRWHHEAWNGRGYPDGLRGESIPLAARIVAVADTFDAVTTTRPYQEGYTAEFAIETITKLVGMRFDAKIVTAFLHAFDRREVTPVRPGRLRYDRAADARVASLN